ncbi:unnamed protein product, partial [Nesidiocoris tenuis]
MKHISKFPIGLTGGQFPSFPVHLPGLVPTSNYNLLIEMDVDFHPRFGNSIFPPENSAAEILARNSGKWPNR